MRRKRRRPYQKTYTGTFHRRTGVLTAANCEPEQEEWLVERRQWFKKIAENRAKYRQNKVDLAKVEPKPTDAPEATEGPDLEAQVAVELKEVKSTTDRTGVSLRSRRTRAKAWQAMLRALNKKFKPKQRDYQAQVAQDKKTMVTTFVAVLADVEAFKAAKAAAGQR